MCYVLCDPNHNITHKAQFFFPLNYRDCVCLSLSVILPSHDRLHLNYVKTFRILMNNKHSFSASLGRPLAAPSAILTAPSTSAGYPPSSGGGLANVAVTAAVGSAPPVSATMTRASALGGIPITPLSASSIAGSLAVAGPVPTAAAGTAHQPPPPPGSIAATAPRPTASKQVRQFLKETRV